MKTSHETKAKGTNLFIFESRVNPRKKKEKTNVSITYIIHVITYMYMKMHLISLRNHLRINK